MRGLNLDSISFWNITWNVSGYELMPKHANQDIYSYCSDSSLMSNLVYVRHRPVIIRL